MPFRFVFIIAVFCLHTHTTFAQLTNRFSIIPKPAQLEAGTGQFTFDSTTTITIPAGQPDLKAIADTLANRLNRTTGSGIFVQTAPNPTAAGKTIQFLPITDAALGEEGYRINVTDRRVTLEAANTKGFFYAVQTLYQLMPPGALGIGKNKSPVPNALATLPACRIQDQPRYRYRGMHLDVSRHFFSVEYIKKYLDLMALHKFNNFHWHLTDDQGWRIEIRKYPNLTQVGAQRRETIVGHYDDSDPQVFDGKPYGGYYTQDDIREVVRYAATKYINVIPEIELPGHALAALASYPELGCSPTGLDGRPYQVATKWGVFEDVFCPTEKTFTFLEDVLTEVMSLFPGKYIHIGGDECPKAAWRKSAFCQRLIKQKGLKNEFGLQRYFVNRIDKFVTSKGRRIIGWDEILEGNGTSLRLSPNATVMSWRGTKYGLDAARKQHDVIMTPGQYCYFDHFQGDPATQPTGFGGSLPLSMVYSYNPTPASLSPADASHILGVQANLWTEYIDTPDQIEYMLWPRAAALAEIAWSPLEQINYDDFSRRLATHFDRLTALDVNFARTFYDAKPSAKPTTDGKVVVSISPSSESMVVPASVVRYTLDGSIPSGESPRYEQPLLLDKSTTVRMATFSGARPLSQLANVQAEYIVSKATGRTYTLLYAPTTGRPDRNLSLTDGTTGSMGGYEVAGVVSFVNDFGVVLDLGQSQSVQSVRVGFLKYTARNICLPKEVEIAVSEDGTTFTPVLTTKTNAAEGGKRGIARLPFDFAPTTARYIRIIARNVRQVPAGLRNPGKTAQLAVDEIEVL
ncbi:family 20 glycosylhydrolase [Spirosoma sp.]|uniref:glycoside hydrolase family 20 protein n=1 Tax=Spirosoma sp. TaxID=1899569 RepID=UPI002601BB25|nr:family 20 glycosylhydrolase [Spirosoma sp.]MCX6214591.1 family 20 glycosylhydrolase [Spirosoma sp.]